MIRKLQNFINTALILLFLGLYVAPIQADQDPDQSQSAESVFAKYSKSDPGRSLDDVLSRSNLTDREQVLALLLEFSAETATIISRAVEAQATEETIIYQCHPRLPESQILEVVDAALVNNVEPESLIDNCLGFLADDEILNFVTTILSRIDPLQMDQILAYFLTQFNFEGLDGTTILVNSLVNGEFLVGNADSGCTGECLRPLAQNLIETLRPPEASGGDLPQSEIDVAEAEPAFSSS